MTSSATNHRIDDTNLHQYRPIYLAFMLGFYEMYPTVTHEYSSSSCKGVTRHAKFILKTEILAELERAKRAAKAHT